MSGLYFRGKLAYARRFARPPEPGDPVAADGVLVITPGAGLRSADTAIGLEQFTAFARTAVDIANPSYRNPLEQGARALLDAVGPECEVVLLGSIASGKYVEILQPIFGERLMFPPAFVGRGDMSRGGLMLRCVMAGVELEYAPIVGAVRKGQRPPRLAPVKGILRAHDIGARTNIVGEPSSPGGSNKAGRASDASTRRKVRSADRPLQASAAAASSPRRRRPRS